MPIYNYKKCPFLQDKTRNKLFLSDLDICRAGDIGRRCEKEYTIVCRLKRLKWVRVKLRRFCAHLELSNARISWRAGLAAVIRQFPILGLGALLVQFDLPVLLKMRQDCCQITTKFSQIQIFECLVVNYSITLCYPAKFS